MPPQGQWAQDAWLPLGPRPVLSAALERILSAPLSSPWSHLKLVLGLESEALLRNLQLELRHRRPKGGTQAWVQSVCPVSWGCPAGGC